MLKTHQQTLRELIALQEPEIQAYYIGNTGKLTNPILQFQQEQFAENDKKKMNVTEICGKAIMVIDMQIWYTDFSHPNNMCIFITENKRH